MTNAIDDAIRRLQTLSQACTSVSVKSAPNYPTENAEPCPFSIAHLASGTGITQSAGMLRFMPVIGVDFYFSVTSLKQAYAQIDLIALEFMQRLGGDPTLNAKVDTIIFSEGVTFETAGLVTWGNVDFLLLRFLVPVKINTTTI